MNLYKSQGRLKACYSSSEILNLLLYEFLLKILSNNKLQNKEYNSPEVSEYIKKLAINSVDSKEYEYYVAILDLYNQFKKNCDFCFNLNNKFDSKKHKLQNINELNLYKEDPPDVIVKYEKQFYEFELKRYRGPLNFESLYDFVYKKIMIHYSGKTNFLITLQPNPNSTINFNIFKKLHKTLKTLKNQPGIISFSFNNENKEFILIQILPNLYQSRRKYESEINAVSKLID